MVDTHVLILAAGMGTRMKSAFPKVLHRVAGRPMIEYALRAISALNVASTTVVVGYGAEQVQTAVGGPACSLLSKNRNSGQVTHSCSPNRRLAA